MDSPGNCLMRIVDDAFIGYWIGFLFVCTWHTGKFALALPFRVPAYYRRPILFKRALRSLYWYRLRESAPQRAGVFALWGFIFTAAECVMETLRNRDDMLNVMVSAACGGLFLGGRSSGTQRRSEDATQKRMRWKQTVQSMALITVLITTLEGVGWYSGKKMGPFTWWADFDPQARYLGLDGPSSDEFLAWSKHRYDCWQRLLRESLQEVAPLGTTLALTAPVVSRLNMV
eukprot:NODE_3645_length_900_cov_9.058754_g3035_i0.p1 GENE.NODE_3645_length_900_cov_9.058754_g3035_i0~~NODE_3645_length_900_cov_9.058754_g3035_i0.p1  ORF type:complete len:230 (+),score=8.80 NODE_3645_length_900_cov_9.058754_g3035_i0:152-841(+)